MEEQIHTPQKQNNNSTAIIVAGLLIAIAIIIAFGQKTDTTPGQRLPTTQEPPSEVPARVLTVREDDFVLGNPATAEVTIFEYSDSDCPFCARFRETIKSVKEIYGDRVAFVYRFHPVDSLHPNARTEALALACVGNLAGSDSFWSYLDKVMSVTLTPSSNLTVLTTFAKEESVDVDLFEECVKSQQYGARVQRDVDEAATIGARGTPYSVAANKKGDQQVISGAVPLESMRAIIDGLLR